MRSARKFGIVSLFIALGIASVSFFNVCFAQESGEPANTATSKTLSSAPTNSSNTTSSSDDATVAAILVAAPRPNESSSLALGTAPIAPPPPHGDRAAKIGIGAKISILGIGIEAATPLSRRFNLRGGFNFFNYDRGFNNNGIHYAAKLSFRSAEAHLDWYLLGPIHLSPGVLFYNGNKLTGNASVPAGQTFTLGGTQYESDPSGANPITGTGQLTFPKAAPSILLGFGNMLPRNGRHFGFNFEIGGEYQGAPTVKLNLQGTACNSSGLNCVNAATDPSVQASIQSQEKKINHDLSPFKFFPQISFGVGINF